MLSYIPILNDDYRFGFNGQEKDNEIKGVGNSLDFGARIYDSRLGRWLSLDPLQAKYPNLSPYNFAGNSPIVNKDFDGKDFGVEIKDNKLIFTMVLYTDNKKNTISNATAAMNYLESLNGQYEFVDSRTGKSYDIVFDVTLKGKENTRNENVQTARNDDEANFIESKGSVPLTLAPGVNGIGGTFGVTYQGGDGIEVSDLLGAQDRTNIDKEFLASWGIPIDLVKRKAIAEGITIHELLHALGVSHEALGASGYQVDKAVIGGIIQYVSDKLDNVEIKLKGNKKGTSLSRTKLSDTEKRNLAKIKNKVKGKVKMKGRVKKKNQGQ